MLYGQRNQNNVHPPRLNKEFRLKFYIGYRVRWETPEGRNMNQPKSCDYIIENKDNSLNSLNDINIIIQY